MSRKKVKEVKEVPVPQPEVDDGFDLMMSALDWYFHVTSCRNHSNAERLEAFRAAHDGFEAFVGDDPTMDAKSNAPTTMTMN
jgi:hypothetical protein